MVFIADSIGKEYKKWENRSIVFISSPTGSGKTTFILQTLLPYLKEKEKKMLYLVNRKILKNQLDNEINKLPYVLQKNIQIELYQNIEMKLSRLYLQNRETEFYLGYKTAVEKNLEEKEKQEKVLKKYPEDMKYQKEYLADVPLKIKEDYECDYVVCDEAHYFLMDSNYNTNTILSYNFIRDYFRDKIIIFMSATIEEVKDYIITDYDQVFCKRTKWFNVRMYENDTPRLFPPEKYTYPKSQNDKLSHSDTLDYIDIHVLKDLKEIVDLVIKGDKKWLIFVDSKKFGRSLRKDILNATSQIGRSKGMDDVVFITADYDLDSSSSREVKDIVRKNKQTAKVVIVTSVLDNGISIKDIQLRDVIIIADTKTEFLQMLGRKRVDGQRLNLYIFKQTKDYFLRRQRINRGKLEAADKYHDKLERILKKEVKKCKYIEAVNLKEEEIIKSLHNRLMQDVMEDVTKFENIKASFLPIDGVLHLNRLSLRNLENIDKFYCELLLEFERYGEYAFVREQLHWLGKTDEEVEKMIAESNRSQSEKAKQQVIEAFNKIVDHPLEEEEFKNFKRKIGNALLILVESVDENNDDRKKYIDMLKKNDRVISKPFMHFIAHNCGIPFLLEIKDSHYIVKGIKS